MYVYKRSIHIEQLSNQSHIWIWSCLIKVDHSSVMTIIYLFIHVFYILCAHYMATTFKLIEHFVEKCVQPLISFQWKNNHLLPLKMTQHFLRLTSKKPNIRLFNGVALSVLCAALLHIKLFFVRGFHFHTIFRYGRLKIDSIVFHAISVP